MQLPDPSLADRLISLLGPAASVAIVATFFIYWRQLKAMQATLAAMVDSAIQQRDTSRHIAQAANALHLSAYLHSPDVYAARSRLLSKLASMPLSLWSDDDRTAARQAIGAYDIAAILAKHQAVPTDILVDNWGASIVSCHCAAYHLIEELRTKHGARWWDDFLHLSEASQAAWNRTVAPSSTAA